MQRCQGEIPVGTHVDQQMREFIDREAKRLAVSKSELLRRLLLVYSACRAGDARCESCGENVRLELEKL